VITSPGRIADPLTEFSAAGTSPTTRTGQSTSRSAAIAAITAALFLQHFSGDVPWAHIDFASAAESPADRHEWTAGPSGFGPRLLLSWLGSDDPLDGIA
jgi:leucyl aminopeptidase